jgi:hypothetical protein
VSTSRLYRAPCQSHHRAAPHVPGLRRAPPHSGAIRTPRRRWLLPFLSPCKHPANAIVASFWSSLATGHSAASRPPPSFPAGPCKHPDAPQAHRPSRVASSWLESSFFPMPSPAPPPLGEYLPLSSRFLLSCPVPHVP